MTLRRADSTVGGVWRGDASPTVVWYGYMRDEEYPHAPIQLQIYRGGSGMLQTVYGWFPVTSYRSTPSGFAFELDGIREVSPDSLDARIIRRAAEVLSSPAVWNRADNRRCTPNATTFSIYCAAVQATHDVTGGTGELQAVDLRRPAMEVIRRVVGERSEGRHYHHRLMEYNNDPATTFSDVQSLFSEASKAMADPAWLAAHGFSVEHNP